jgi:threonine dehydrogenase-like Zn-dependent dehydrogenase
MRALVFTAPSVVEVLDVPEVIVGDDEVILHVERAGICGSDLHGIRQPGFRVPPLIMGHEFVGRTDDGRRVAVNPLLTCGTCELCLRGKVELCRTRVLLGVHRAGGFAERVAVPRTLLHDLPDTISWDHAGLIEPVANALHAWHLAGSPSGQRIGIIGCGPIGLACVEVALASDAAYVACAELSSERGNVAREIGAHHVADELEGEFDVIFDAVGTTSTRSHSLDHLIPGGVTIWLGLATAESSFDASVAVRFEKTIRGSFAYSSEEFITAIELAPRLALTWSTTYPLSQGADIFLALMNGKTTPIKALLQP